MFRLTVSLHTSLDRKGLSSFFAGLIGEDGSRPFRGRADGEGFHIEEIKVYRSSFLPRVCGRYVVQGEGTGLHLSLRPHREVLLFLGLWGLFLLLVAAVIIFSALPSRPVRMGLLLLPVLLGALTFYLSFRVFRSDCRWTVDALKERLDTFLVP